MKKSAQPPALAPETYLPVTVVVRGRKVHLRLHFDEDGGFWVDSTNMRGLVTQGETTEEAISNGVDAALALIEAESMVRRKTSR